MAAAVGTIVAQFQTVEGEPTGPQLDLPVDLTPEQLQLLINELLKNVWTRTRRTWTIDHLVCRRLALTPATRACAALDSGRTNAIFVFCSRG